MSVIVHLPFAEQEDVVLPSDIAGGLSDLHGDPAGTPALTVPPIVDSAVGLGREFGNNLGLIGADETAGQTLITQDLSIEVALQIDPADVTGTATIIQRGDGSSLAERILWGLQIESFSEEAILLRWRWQDSTGAEASVPAQILAIPDSPVYLWAVRRWISPTEGAEVRYGAGELQLGSGTGEGIAMGPGVGEGATTLVGCDRVGTVYSKFFPGTIMALRVHDEELATEEFRQVFRAINVHQPAGYDSIRGLTPPRVYSSNPESIIQRELQIEGAALGAVAAQNKANVEDGLPDRAHHLLPRWETITKLFPLPRDSVATRRSRAASRFGSIQGFNVDKILEPLEKTLDCEASQLEIIELSNRRTDPFDTLRNSWFRRAGFGEGSEISAGGELTLEANGGVATPWPRDAVWIARSIDSVPGTADAHVGTYFKATLVSQADLGAPGTSMSGIIAYDAKTKHAILLGYDSPTQLRVFSFDGSAWAVEHTFAAAALPRVLHMHFDAPGSVVCGVATTGAPNTFVEQASVAITVEPDWIGLALVVDDLGGLVPTATWDDAEFLFPNGEAPFYWFIYRDPAIGGSPDMAGARKHIATIKPAHTIANVVESDEAFFSDTLPGFGVPVGD